MILKRTRFSIKNISFFGLITLIVGSSLSGAILLYLLVFLEKIKDEQIQIDNAHDALYELIYVTERLLTTYQLEAVRGDFIEAKDSFESSLMPLNWIETDKGQEFTSLWMVVKREIVSIDKQLEHPIFLMKNMQDKSLLRRLGEGLNLESQHENYLLMSRLFNSIEHLKQYEAFLLDELATLRTQEQLKLAQKLIEIKQLAFVLPSLIMVATLIFMIYIARLIGKTEEDLVASRHDLQASLEKFEYLFNTTMESIFLIENGRCIDVNEKALEMFGFLDRSQIVGKEIMEIVTSVSPEELNADLSLESSDTHELTALKYDGTQFPVLCRGYGFTSRGREIQILAMLDLSDIKEKDAQLRETVLELQEKQSVLDYQAHYDALTALPNRFLFLDRFHHAITKSMRNHTNVVLLYIDLDRFKEINDSLGHTVGDRVLKLVSERLMQVLREQDTIARFGGDEFTLLLEDVTSMEPIREIASKIIETLQAPMFLKNHELYITTSIGISSFPDDGETPEVLLSNADAAMYKAKAEGKNNYQFYTEDMTELAYERITMERNIRHGLDSDIFELYY
jgi:diguanylate cyclase (GGDEF)-like protein/PAS domain S-box-containing protein